MKNAGTVDYLVEDYIVLSKESGKGIKLGALEDGSIGGSPRFGWRDITGQVAVRGVGAADPSWSRIGSGPFYAYSFALGDECWMAFHIPHDIAPSSPVHCHTHWLPSGINAAVVKWQYTYTYAKGFNQEAFSPAGTVVTAQSAGPGVAYQHMVTETEAIVIPTLTEPDGVVYVHIKRVTNGGTDNTDTIFMLTSDLHYQSTSLATIGKAPNFYDV